MVQWWLPEASGIPNTTTHPSQICVRGEIPASNHPQGAGHPGRTYGDVEIGGFRNRNMATKCRQFFITRWDYMYIYIYINSYTGPKKLRFNHWSYPLLRLKWVVISKFGIIDSTLNPLVDVLRSFVFCDLLLDLFFFWGGFILTSVYHWSCS